MVVICTDCDLSCLDAKTLVKCHDNLGRSISKSVRLICPTCGDERERYFSRVIPTSKGHCKDCFENRVSPSWTGENHHNWKGDERRLSCKLCGDSIGGYEDQEYCGECFDNRRSEIWGKENHPNWQGEPEVRVCSLCGDEKEYRPYYYRDHEYCENCFHNRRDEILGGENHPRWKGGLAPTYGENWTEIREEIRDRDGECRICGLSRQDQIQKYTCDFPVHHLVPRRTFLESETLSLIDGDVKPNLVSLCSPCHAKIDSEVIHPSEVNGIRKQIDGMSEPLRAEYDEAFQS